MSIASLLRLICLAAIWGGAFIFTRVGAPILGPTLLIESRVGLAALFLVVVSLIIRSDLQVRENWNHYLILGFVNAALPFLLFGFAAQTLSASLLSILNATSPIFGAILGALFAGQMLSKRKIFGLGLGIAGVALLVGFEKTSLQPGAGMAVAAALAASLCYGIAATYAKRANSVSPFRKTHGSMWAATLLIAPAVYFFPANEPATMGVMLSVLALGVVCSGIAFLLYFRLVADIGPASTLTVTFLIPIFGIIWGHIFLREEVGWYTLGGAAIILSGTALATGFSYNDIFAKGRVLQVDRA